MASLYDYFVNDFNRHVSVQREWSLERPDGSTIVKVIARLHYDFESNSKFVSFFIPFSEDIKCPEAILLNNLQDVLDWPTTLIGVQDGAGDDAMHGKDLVFAGRVYFYTERPLDAGLKTRLLKEANDLGHNIIFRSTDYLAERVKWEKPKAFISHDSRDKAEIAEPLAIGLHKLMCPVWFDEYSLKVGDSLREAIESGLRECHKCIFILTPNFLANGGWSKREYDSIFTRELVEKRNVILPVWHRVSREEVYEYSPVLADRVAVHWSDGLEKVIRKLKRAIDSV